MPDKREYDKETLKRLMRLGRIASQLLEGYDIEEIAKEEGKTAKEVRQMLDELEVIYPLLYKLVKGKLDDWSTGSEIFMSSTFPF